MKFMVCFIPITYKKEGRKDEKAESCIDVMSSGTLPWSV